MNETDAYINKNPRIKYILCFDMMVLALYGQVTATALSIDTKANVGVAKSDRNTITDEWMLHTVLECVLGSYPAMLMLSIPQLIKIRAKSKMATSLRSIAVMESLKVGRKKTTRDKLLRTTPVTSKMGTLMFHIIDTVLVGTLPMMIESPVFLFFFEETVIL